MSMLWACYIVYNDIDYIRASLSTIIHHVDHIILVDGRFAYYPGSSPVSTDGTLKVIKEFKKKYPYRIKFVKGKVYPDEPTKRNVYLDMVPENDWIWIIDGDEIPYGNLERVKPYLATKNSLVVPIWFRHAFLHRPEFVHMRFIRKKRGMKYDETHFTIFYKGQNILDADMWKNVDPVPVWLIHFGELRFGGKTIDKNKFREKLEAVEGKFADAIFPGKFDCVIPGCDNGANEVRLASRGISYIITICKKHKKEYLQQPIIDIIQKYGDSERNLRIKEIYAPTPKPVVKGLVIEQI